MDTPSIAVIEGNTLLLDGGAMFGNAPKELWKRWMTPDEKNRIALATRGLFFRLPSGKNVLIEVGVGSFFSPDLRLRFGVEEVPHKITDNLKKIGVKEEEIDAVLLTHLHFDHAGGLLSSYEEGANLLFPNATYFVGREHWKHAVNPPKREKSSFIPHLHDALQESNRLHFIDGESDTYFGDSISFFYTNGHTVGLMHPLIAVNGKRVAVVSDLIPGQFWLNTALAMGYDRYAELTSLEKENFLKKAVLEKIDLFFSHDPLQSIVTVIEDERGYRAQ